MFPSMDPGRHAFVLHPHRTLVALSLPVMMSMAVEPIAGLADTAFVERLGSPFAAALAAATAVFSGVVWVFNFLGIGTQTEVAQSWGRNAADQARRIVTLAVALSAVWGLILACLAWPALPWIAGWMAEDPLVRSATMTYLEIRLVGAPALLVVVAALGALRGLQLMRATLWITATMSLLNIAADPVLIFGLGPFPELGIEGAAWATTGSQIIGAAISLLVVERRLGFDRSIAWRRAGRLMVIGRDMFLRTGALLLFILIATRSAVRIGVDAGAAHQATRQIWLLLAFLLDGIAYAAQSLIGFFLGARQTREALRVARVACGWGIGVGLALTAALLALKGVVAALLVPTTATSLFGEAWLACALVQPLNAVSFVTDGIHWGTGDFAYLRNAMLVATTTGVAFLVLMETSDMVSLALVWWITGLWIAIRAVFGLARIWPGTAASPLRAADGASLR